MRRALVVVSLASCAYGAWLVLHLPGRDLVRVLLWLAGVVVVHDLVFAPLVHAGARLLGLLPSAFVAPAQAYAIVVGTTLLATMPTWLALGKTSLEESLLPRPYTPTVLVLLAGGLVLAAAWGLVRHRSSQRREKES